MANEATHLTGQTADKVAKCQSELPDLSETAPKDR